MGTKARGRAGTNHAMFPSGLGPCAPLLAALETNPPFPPVCSASGSRELMRGRKSSRGLFPLGWEAPAAVPGSSGPQAPPGPLQGFKATSSLRPGSSLKGPLQWGWGGVGSLLSGLLARGYNPGSPLWEEGLLAGPAAGPGPGSWPASALLHPVLSEMALLSQFCGYDAAALAGPTDTPSRSAGAASRGCRLWGSFQHAPTPAPTPTPTCGCRDSGRLFLASPRDRSPQSSVRDAI